MRVRGSVFMYSTVVSALISGVSSRRVIMDADVSEGLSAFCLVGFLASETRAAAPLLKLIRFALVMDS